MSDHRFWSLFRQSAAVLAVRLGIGLFACGLGLPAALLAASGGPLPRVERLDPRLDSLWPPSMLIERVVDGFEWMEGPVWSVAEGALYFSDIPKNAVFRWRPGSSSELFLARSGYTGSVPFAGREPGSNGLAFDSDGRLLLCQHGDRRIVRLEADGTLRALASGYRGKRLNSPNDLALRTNGEIYFTDPPFGLPTGFGDPGRELEWSGVYRIAGGEVELLARDLDGPNGLAFSPDERVLYVSNAQAERAIWMRYPVLPDGTLGPGRVFFDVTDRVAAGRGLPDGLEVDDRGNLFATGPEGVYVFTPAGDHLGTLHTGVPTANVAWGEDGRTLFVVASPAIYRLRTGARGSGFDRVAAGER